MHYWAFMNVEGVDADSIDDCKSLPELVSRLVRDGMDSPVVIYRDRKAKYYPGEERPVALETYPMDTGYVDWELKDVDVKDLPLMVGLDARLDEAIAERLK